MIYKTAYQLPRYREVYEQLRKHIENGVYAPGDLLPSENELCAVNQVTRPTVRRALDMLANEGYIRKHQGLGSVVQNPPKGIGILSFSGTTSAIGKENLKTSAIVKPHARPWPEEFVFDLSDLERESGCIYFERIRYVNDAPVFYDLSYLPNINLPRFTARNLNNLSLFELLREQYRIEIKGGMQYIEAITATESCQQHLGVAPERPILNLQRKLSTNRLDYFVYSILYCNTEEHSLYGEF
jgi:GntR family transcriptional regulator/GntR family frlABCD operon transcriptional regulator